MARSCVIIIGRSFGACSPSISSQSKPVLDEISTAVGEVSACQNPICVRPSFSACLKVFFGAGMDGFLLVETGDETRGGSIAAT